MTTRASVGVTRHCNSCGCEFVRSQSSKTTFCPDCRRGYFLNYRIRRKVEGNPVRTPPKTQVSNRLKQLNDPVKRVKLKARRTVKNAITAGVLIRQPCETCLSEPSQAHHDDYSKPLVVRWLCRTHHMELHRTWIKPQN